MLQTILEPIASQACSIANFVMHYYYCQHLNVILQFTDFVCTIAFDIFNAELRLHHCIVQTAFVCTISIYTIGIHFYTLHFLFCSEIYNICMNYLNFQHLHSLLQCTSFVLTNVFDSAKQVGSF